MAIFERNFTINCTDVNRYNKLKPQALVNYLQQVAAAHSDSIQDGLYYLGKTNSVWILLNWRIKILEDLKWNEDILVKTWSRKLEKFYAFRDFEVYKGETLIATASSKWCLLDIQTGSFKKPTEELMAKYTLTDKMVFDKELEKVKEAEEMELKYTYTILEKDIDVNSHVNNSYYIDYAMCALENDAEVSDLEIAYKKECKVGDIIDIYVSKIDLKENIITIKNRENAQVSAILKITLK